MNEVTSLANPHITDIGPTARRTAQPMDAVLPENTTVVSSDCHWEVCEDIFYEAFPANLKDKAPRVWFDKFWHLGYPNQAEAVSGSDEGTRIATQATTAGLTDLSIRQRHLAIEGVDKEIVYPQSLLFFVGHKDRQVQELIWRTYNQYIAGVSKSSGGTFHGVGVFSNWWEPGKAEAAMQQLVDLGLKSFMIPIYPKTEDGKDISYADQAFDRFWAVAEEAGLPVSFHISEAFMPGPRGQLGAVLVNATSHFRKPWSQMVFGGVFDRHPNLKIVFAEGGLAWVLPSLQEAEMIYDSFGDLLDPIKERPSHYWHNNCYATFQNDLLGLRNLEYIGANNVLWSNDYPHCEGSYGYTPVSMQCVLDHTTPQEARNILGGTAMKLYNLDA